MTRIRRGVTLGAMALVACASERTVEPSSPHVDPTTTEEAEAAGADPSQLVHVSVLSTQVDARLGLCVSSASGRVHCSYEHEGWAWREITGLDGTHGVFVEVGGEICAISRDHQLECTTLRTPDVREPVVSGVERVVGDLGIRCGLSSDRALTCWGRDDSLGELLRLPERWFFGDAPSDADGHIPPTLIARSVDDVAVTGHHVCVLAGGTLTCEGANAYGQTTDAPAAADGRRTVALEDVTAVSASGLVTCAIARGEVWCWGEVGSEDVPRECIHQLAYPLPRQRHAVPARFVPASSGAPYVALDAGRALSCVETADHELWCWSMRDAEGTLRHVASSVAGFDVAGTSVCVLDTRGLLMCDGEAIDPPSS